MEREDKKSADQVKIVTGRTAIGVVLVVLVAVLLLVAIRYFFL